MKKVHGDFSITLCGDIIFTTAEGPWNAEAVDAFQLEYFHVRLPVVGKRWGDLVELKGESLMIPAAESLLIRSIIDSARCGLSDVAIVLANSTVKTIAKQQFMNIYRSSGLNVAFFDSKQQGLDWLAAQGLHCSDSVFLKKLGLA